MEVESTPAPCRIVVHGGGLAVRWVGPFAADDRQRLRSWCDAVGPAVVNDIGRSSGQAGRGVVIGSWNMAVGEGDLHSLVEQLRAERPGSEVIVLLQEAYRAEAPPSDCPAASRRARALARPRPPGSSDIVTLAARVGMNLAYAPSMRNGLDCAVEPREDRGNAILSTLPLSDVAMIELPFAQQRRVAVAARVRTAGGDVGLVSVHFDTLRGHAAMAEGMAQALRILGWRGPLVVAGDFNSALPFDGGMREMRRHFAELDCGGGATHETGRRLDHMFIGLEDAPFGCRTGGVRYGSDHNPLIAVVPADERLRPQAVGSVGFAEPASVR